jgi:hypothetical protein
MLVPSNRDFVGIGKLIDRRIERIYSIIVGALVDGTVDADVDGVMSKIGMMIDVTRCHILWESIAMALN